MFRDVEATLTGSLPCIHEIDPVSGEHSTMEAAPEGAANYVHTGTLTRMSEENDIKIQHQVFDPIDKWISEVDVSLPPPYFGSTSLRASFCLSCAAAGFGILADESCPLLNMGKFWTH